MINHDGTRQITAYFDDNGPRTFFKFNTGKIQKNKSKFQKRKDGT